MVDELKCLHCGYALTGGTAQCPNCGHDTTGRPEDCSCPQCDPENAEVEVLEDLPLQIRGRLSDEDLLLLAQAANRRLKEEEDKLAQSIQDGRIRLATEEKQLHQLRRYKQQLNVVLLGLERKRISPESRP